jgi:hypothetical protein
MADNFDKYPAKNFPAKHAKSAKIKTVAKINHFSFPFRLFRVFRGKILGKLIKRQIVCFRVLLYHFSFTLNTRKLKAES